MARDAAHCVRGSSASGSVMRIPRDRARFSLGAPDRGVARTYSPRGERLGHQRKFVRTIDDAIAQMRTSLRTALSELPDLVEMTLYVPCELPEATPPARARGRRQSATARWDAAVARWRSDLPGAERLRSIGLVDGPQLLERLTRDEHRGRLFFFFFEKEFLILSGAGRTSMRCARALVLATAQTSTSISRSAMCSMASLFEALPQGPWHCAARTAHRPRTELADSRRMTANCSMRAMRSRDTPQRSRGTECRSRTMSRSQQR